MKTRLVSGVLLLCIVILSAGCDSTSPETEEQVVEGIDLDALFAPPTATEIQSVRTDWGDRDVAAQDINVAAEGVLTLTGSTKGNFRVISHRVAGIEHFGAVIVPQRASMGSLPVIVYTHPSDQGVNVDETLALFSLGIGQILDEFVYVVPSFRDESITIGGETYQSDGPASPWDYDIDDALALLNAALQTTPEADPERIGVIGFSRGGGVGLLMSARDPRIDLVAEFFGPTDFFDPDVRETTAEALQGTLRDLPGLDFLNATYFQPLKNGVVALPDIRLELLRRSPVYFAESLPEVQIQHGEADDVVDVNHARTLEATLTQLGRSTPELEVFYYPGAGHSPIEMTGSFDRLIEFVSRLIDTPT